MGISEPFQSDDKRWWVRSDVSNETHNFATSEEAYHFYHRMLEIQARLDGGSRTDLNRPPLTEPVNLPLSKVPETRPPHLDVPILTEEETKKANEAQTEQYLAALERDEAKSGKTPWTYFFRKWIGPAIVGVSALAVVLMKSCG